MRKISIIYALLFSFFHLHIQLYHRKMYMAEFYFVERPPIPVYSQVRVKRISRQATALHKLQILADKLGPMQGSHSVEKII